MTADQSALGNDRKPTYVPPMRAYEMSDLASDLVELALWLLKPGGRLVFFLPTVSEDYTELDVPVREGMTVVGNGVQDFGKWARRVSDTRTKSRNELK